MAQQTDKEQQKKLLIEIMEADDKDGLYETNNMEPKESLVTYIQNRIIEVGIENLEEHHLFDILNEASRIEKNNMEESKTPIGLTKREYFAAMAMQGMLANNANGNTEWNYDTIAIHSCKAADSLMSWLDEEPSDIKS